MSDDAPAPVAGIATGRGRRPGAREAILDAIRAAETLSRVELSAATGLTEASVSTTVRRLLDEGLVVETGRAPSGGKPRTMLRLDPAARIAVGVHLDDDVTTYVLTGQTGGIIARMNRPTPAGAGPEATLARLVADIAGLVDGSGIDRARCLGIGLVWSGSSARPAASAGDPHPAGRYRDDLARRLAGATDWPVLLENDATAAAVGEYWVARVEAARPFAALYMAGGIGAGIVLDGVALRGRHAHAGEFGHLCLQVDGPLCWCGSRGCLEALAGPPVVVAAALADPVAAGEAGLDPAVRRSTVADFAAVARAARAGAPACRALLNGSARYVAAAAESLVNLLDVNLLVLTGPGFAAASFVYGPAITERIAAADARTWRRGVSVTVSLAAATASATGAAALVLQSSLRG
ncbi:ROK family transcriptional regulator [Amorphoplanes nipponensis]|uniref:Sugar kinase n=1 Tax=Actinoplanes nipponensis TaxID=135950 RepID=A0A919JD18_9ACTN|nr:ROK family transcriptional regulator [Actinoplanes nipponensis]GIE47342.1 sugar kinase [Actinoplanes nipponensis]